MARYKANEVSWEKVEVMGKECLFSSLRIDRESIPEGYFMYEIRHDDEDWGEPIQIGEWVMVNFFGTLLSKEQFVLEPTIRQNNAYLWLEDDSWSYLDEFVKL
jgi:hypothetical protein